MNEQLEQEYREREVTALETIARQLQILALVLPSAAIINMGKADAEAVVAQLKRL